MSKVSQAEFARIANVNRSTVTRWIQNGRIVPEADGRIDVDVALRQRNNTESTEPRHQARKAQFDEEKATAATAGSEPLRESAGQRGAGYSTEGLGVSEKIGLLHKQASLKRLQAQAELANLQLDAAAKLLIERETVEFVLADFGKTLVGLMENLPDRLTPELMACGPDAREIHKTLEDSFHDLLAELQQHLQRKTQEHA